MADPDRPRIQPADEGVEALVLDSPADVEVDDDDEATARNLTAFGRAPGLLRELHVAGHSTGQGGMWKAADLSHASRIPRARVVLAVRLSTTSCSRRVRRMRECRADRSSS